MKAVVVGGGIGGLATALCLGKIGWDVEVWEQAEVLTEVGAGIQLSPNGFKVLEALGLGPEIRAKAFEPEALELRMGKSGRRIFKIALGNQAQTAWGGAYLHIHRADLVEVLAKALEETARSALKLGRRFQQGKAVEADLVIGADGLHSAVRFSLFGSQEPRFTGNFAWRAVVPTSGLDPETVPPPTACVWAGPGQHAVTYKLRQGSLLNFVGVVESQGAFDEAKDWETAEGQKQSALFDFAGWHPTVTGLIAAAPSLKLWPLFDRAPLARWSKGASVLLGDAAHPMLPTMAQGGAMALEDAWVLAACLEGQAGDLPAALQRFEAVRKPRTTAMSKQSLRNVQTFHHRSKLAQVAHYAGPYLAGKFAPQIVRRRLDWIYGHSVIDAPLALQK